MLSMCLIITKTQGRVPSTPSPLYGRGGMTLDVRPRVNTVQKRMIDTLLHMLRISYGIMPNFSKITLYCVSSNKVDFHPRPRFLLWGMNGNPSLFSEPALKGEHIFLRVMNTDIISTNTISPFIFQINSTQ